MSEPKIVLKSDGVYMEKQINEHIFETVPIITKEVFIEAFIKWIEHEEQEHEHVALEARAEISKLNLNTKEQEHE